MCYPPKLQKSKHPGGIIRGNTVHIHLNIFSKITLRGKIQDYTDKENQKLIIKIYLFMALLKSSKKQKLSSKSLNTILI